MTQRKKAMVIGGSLGGLFAANLLLRAGWDVHVYDAAGHIVAAHAGGTPGYSSYIAVDRASGIAVVVLADGKTNVQALGERLMTTPLG